MAYQPHLSLVKPFQFGVAGRTYVIGCWMNAISGLGDGDPFIAMVTEENDVWVSKRSIEEYDANDMEKLSEVLADDIKNWNEVLIEHRNPKYEKLEFFLHNNLKLKDGQLVIF